MYDCRSPNDSHKSWKLSGEVERVAWNIHDPYYFLASTDTGFVHCLDVRASEPVFQLKAHDSAVTGLSFSRHMAGCVLTTSQDKSFKIWDVRNHTPSMVFKKEPKLGEMTCSGASPDSPLVYAVAGERELRVINFHKNEEVVAHFNSKLSANAGSGEILEPQGKYELVTGSSIFFHVNFSSFSLLFPFGVIVMYIKIHNKIIMFCMKKND